ncbi:hypothetical protein HG452_000625 [Candidatus Saccharibacteria bacterium]|nr:hypothetical protein [Candidatus Saccharibacteria bacterium]
MKNTEWNKLTIRPLDEEEKEYYKDYKDSKIEFMWEGDFPEDGEEVLVYTPQSKSVYTDIWSEYGNDVGFENTDKPVIYWMSFPKQPKIEEKKDE